MQTPDTRQQKRNAQFQAFRSGDGVDIADVLARLVIVMITGLALWHSTGQRIMLIWWIGYWIINSSYIFFYLRRKSGNASRADIVICVCASALIALWYCAMVIYVATFPNGDFLFLSACGVLGLALHCLARNVDFSYSAYIDFFAVIVTGLGVTLLAAVDATTANGALACALGGLFASGYFWLSFRQMITVNRALAAKMREDNQNQKMLALGQLASGVAHDFNNLLTVIKGNIELVILSPDNPENDVYLADAKMASDKSAGLVRQLLAYGRKSDLKISKVGLGPMFEELEGLLRRVLPAHIRLKIHGPVLEPLLYVDRDLLESAVMNLIINAQKSIADTPGTICLSAQPKPTGTSILISVTDTGKGMTPEVLARASEPFFTTRSVGEGSGLGLSMAKGFAVQSGGSLTFANLGGGGFRATIELPMSAPLQEI